MTQTGVKGTDWLTGDIITSAVRMAAAFAGCCRRLARLGAFIQHIVNEAVAVYPSRQPQDTLLQGLMA